MWKVMKIRHFSFFGGWWGGFFFPRKFLFTRVSYSYFKVSFFSAAPLQDLKRSLCFPLRLLHTVFNGTSCAILILTHLKALSWLPCWNALLPNKVQIFEVWLCVSSFPSHQTYLLPLSLSYDRASSILTAASITVGSTCSLQSAHHSSFKSIF